MLINVFELPETQRIIKAAEAQILSNTGIEVSLTAHLKCTDIEYKKMLLQKFCCLEFNTNWYDVVSGNRARLQSATRHTYMYLLRTYFKFSLESIGTELGKDHTSVINAIKKINGYYKVGDSLITHIENIKKNYNNALL